VFDYTCDNICISSNDCVSKIKRHFSSIKNPFIVNLVTGNCLALIMGRNKAAKFSLSFLYISDNEWYGLLLSYIKVLKTNYNKKLMNCFNQNVLYHVVVRVTYISYNHST
jgi:hypothetical protein